MRIGIMGGTFDPIHNGHIMLGEYAYRQFDLDEVWFMPNGNPPHKQDNLNRTDAKIRSEMVALAIKDYPQFKLQEHEINRKEISYSYQTMEYFHNKYPEHEFYFIIGADSLSSIESWMKPERLLKTCTMLAAFRDEMNCQSVMKKQIEELNQKYNADIRLLNTPLVDVSSSQLREDIKNNRPVGDKIHENVIDYIKKHQLYC
ncbi:MAG: nicotinate-nucleotide adenylyltransferase [Eubacteriales bacterium]|nr:nicotinate-nucleotide adenylyltransferase [Eubacteriales bacterium]